MLVLEPFDDDVVVVAAAAAAAVPVPVTVTLVVMHHTKLGTIFVNANVIPRRIVVNLPRQKHFQCHRYAQRWVFDQKAEVIVVCMSLSQLARMLRRRDFICRIRQVRLYSNYPRCDSNKRSCNCTKSEKPSPNYQLLFAPNLSEFVLKLIFIARHFL